MRKSIFILTALTLYAIDPAHADWSFTESGTWPKSWPVELEPLRKQARSFTGGLYNVSRYQLLFDKREEFESAWPYLLKIKSEGAPLILRKPFTIQSKLMSSGVWIQCPPKETSDRSSLVPVPGRTDLRRQWINKTFIELVVDGRIVDLNRIPLPADTPIIDERFHDVKNK